MLHIMEHSVIERIAGAAPGSYKRAPEATYLAMQHAIGTCLLDQYIPENPLTMEDLGYERQEKGATEGTERIVVDGLLIDSPEAVVEHMERFVLPEIRGEIAAFDEDAQVAAIISDERAIHRNWGRRSSRVATPSSCSRALPTAHMAMPTTSWPTSSILR